MPSTKTHRRSALAVALCLFAAIILVIILPNWAMADPIYDNGPPDTSYGPVVFGITGTDTISDSFTLPSETTLTGGGIALWVNSYYAPVCSVDLGISASQPPPFVTNSPGTVILDGSSLGVTFNGYTLYDVDFTLATPLQLAPGEYWLTLTNHQSLAPNTPSNDAFWAASADPPDGSGVVLSWYWGNSPIPVESFHLDGTPAPNHPPLRSWYRHCWG